MTTHTTHWWKLDIWSGPGRQSHHIQYVWREFLSNQGVEDWKRELHEESDDWEYGPAIIEVNRVKGLPPDEHARQLEYAKARIKDGRTMLRILKETQVEKCTSLLVSTT